MLSVYISESYRYGIAMLEKVFVPRRRRTPSAKEPVTPVLRARDATAFKRVSSSTSISGAAPRNGSPRSPFFVPDVVMVALFVPVVEWDSVDMARVNDMDYVAARSSCATVLEGRFALTRLVGLLRREARGNRPGEQSRVHVSSARVFEPDDPGRSCVIFGDAAVGSIEHEVPFAYVCEHRGALIVQRFPMVYASHDYAERYLLRRLSGLGSQLPAASHEHEA